MQTPELAPGLCVQFRYYTPADENFVFHAWIVGVRKRFPHARNSDYYPKFHPILTYLVNRCVPIIACDAKNPNELFGFCVAEKIDNETVIHYMYVKFPFRKFGIGRELWKICTKDDTQPPFATFPSYWGPILGQKPHYKHIYQPEILEKILHLPSERIKIT